MGDECLSRAFNHDITPFTSTVSAQVPIGIFTLINSVRRLKGKDIKQTLSNEYQLVK